MTNLKNDLDEYLLLQSDQKKSFKIDMKMPTIKVPEIKSFFGRKEPEEANSWLQDTQESCCPKLVGIPWNYIISRWFSTTIFLIAVTTTTNHWFYRMHRTGSFLYGTISRMELFMNWFLNWEFHLQTVSTFYIPVLILKARKFSLLFSLGSLFFILR